MRKLFGIEKDSSQGVQSFPEWEYIKSGFERNLEQVVSHYKRFPSRIDSSHFITKLIFSMGIGLNMSVERYFANVSARYLSASMAARMTSAVYKGDIHNGVFFGEGSKEIIIAHADSFNIFETETKWETWQPVRVLLHPKSDLMINVPDGTSTSSEEGLSVIAINVPMLMLQYQQWKLREDAKSKATGESPKAVMDFIYSYPLVNSVYSVLDSAIFNRLYNRLCGIPLGESRRKHPFMLTDYTNRLNDLQTKQLSVLAGTNRSFDAILKTIPLVSKRSLIEYSDLPETVLTRQVIWGLVASRIRLLSFLARASGTARTANASEINRVARALRLYGTVRALRNSLPLDIFLDISNELERIVR